MKLSDAIRDGIELVPNQIREGYVTFDANGEVTGACTLTTAAIALGYKPTEPNCGLEVHACINSKTTAYFYVPTDPHASDSLGDIIIDQSDRLLWTREQTADWLESIGY